MFKPLEFMLQHVRAWLRNGSDGGARLRRDLNLPVLRGGRKGGEVTECFVLQEVFRLVVSTRPTRTDWGSTESRPTGLECFAWIRFLIAALCLLLSQTSFAAAKFARNTAALTNHWAFQPVHNPAVPTTTNPGWVQTPVDAFILEKLEQNGLTPSPAADARTLVRRAFYDLHGLPPSFTDVEAFARECESVGRPKAFAARVERLLDSPRYGERWGRHWLDVSRYADTSGYLPKGQKQFAGAYTYRDYVVRAFNEDLPYNEFVLEQLAADQLPPRNGKPRSLQSMGFLTLGRVFVNNRHDILDDRIDVVARGLMGLTVTCARCHDHPFDPIASAEYYALYGVFTNSLETVEDIASPGARSAFSKERDAAKAELARLEADTSADTKPECVARKARLKNRLGELAWLDLSGNEMSLGLADAAEPVAAHVFIRGNPDAQGDPVKREFLELAGAGKRNPMTHGSGRLELAQAIVSQDNPLTARVMVNRVWMHHFGQGLVRTPGDFGTRAEPPTHPELLDWLANWFVENGWSMKKLHRLIMGSAVYQQGAVISDRKSVTSNEATRTHANTDHSSLITDYSPASRDPDNRFLWRMNRQRLDFESMRDSLLAMAGRLDLVEGGPPVKLVKQPFVTRRTLYGYLDRSDIPGLHTTFDFPVPDALCPRRFETTVPQSALFFLNSEFVQEQSKFLAARATKDSNADASKAVEAVFKLALQRPPAQEETADARRLISQAGANPFQPPVWQFGFGEYDGTKRQVKSFERMPIFQDGSWRGGTDLPDKDKRHLSHNASGGHPGKNNTQAAIRRWVSPVTGKVSIEGLLSHALKEGDGVRGMIVSSRAGELGRWDVRESEAKTTVRSVEVKAGDTLDFVVEGGKDTRFDHFVWAPVIRLIEGAPRTGVAVWDAHRDFREASEAWDQKPLSGLEVLSQALLMSNEFMFVD